MLRNSDSGFKCEQMTWNIRNIHQRTVHQPQSDVFNHGVYHVEVVP